MAYLATKLNVKVLKCPFCKWTAKQEPRFYEHLASDHNITLSELPELFIQHELSGIRPVCACTKCQVNGTLTNWCGWKKGFPSPFLRGHNVNIENAPIRSKDILCKAQQSRRDSFERGEWIPHNTGKTKENDPTVAATAEKISATVREGYTSGRILKPIKTGDTKETNPILAKSSQTKKNKYASGTITAFGKGETKDTNEKIFIRSQKISKKMRGISSVRRHTPEQVHEIVSQQDVFDLISDPETYKNKYGNLLYRCRKNNHIQMKNLMQIKKKTICYLCHPMGSAAQLEIGAYIESLGFEIDYNSRSIIAPREIDIYVPVAKLAIEYDGLYWHTIDKIPRELYHHEKYEMCAEKGVKFFRVYEDEWRDKREIIEGMLKHRLGMREMSIGARKTTLKKLSSLEAKSFFEENHLEGNVQSIEEAFGLFHGDCLVAAMSLRLSISKNAKYKSKRVLEVARAAMKIGCNVPGWLGKLTKAARDYAIENKYDILMTYVDRRVGNGQAYSNAGWKWICESAAPRLWWSNYNERIHRLSFRSDPVNGKTQVEVARLQKYYPLYGCKNGVYEIEL